jgi:acyl-CoA synthetase (AMP-forming)/AMP-acid ligase II
MPDPAPLPAIHIANGGTTPAAVPLSTPDLLTLPAKRRPDSLAVIDGAVVLTYQELATRARRAAHALAALADPGDRVVLLLPRSADSLVAYFAVHLAGLVPIVLHDQIRPRQASSSIDNADVVLAVTVPRLRPVLTGGALADHQVFDLAALLDPDRTSPAGAQPHARRIGRDLAQIIYTSGSTGTAKGVMVSHDNLVAGAVLVASYLRLTSRDRTLAALPWSFDYGLNQVLATFAAHGTVVIQRAAIPARICRSLATAHVTGLAGVPGLWSALTSPPARFLREHYPALRYITNSGGHLPEPVIRAIRAAHPDTDIYAMYGLTEAFRSTYLPPDKIDHKPASIGRPIPGSDLLIVDAHDRPCPPGTEGQFVHRGPTVTLGYWRDPHGTAQVFRPHPAPPPGAVPETVVYTGDFGYADPDGDLYWTGRRDEMFKSLGIRVTPTEIETALRQLPAITDAVVAVHHREDGTEPVIVAGICGGPGLTLDTVYRACAAEMPPHMHPHRIMLLDVLPFTSHGKPDRPGLLRMMTATTSPTPGTGAQDSASAHGPDRSNS